MRGVVLGAILILASAITGASVAIAQAPPEGGAVGQGAVTVLTDGIADLDGRTSRGIGELAARLSTVGTLRVLPLMGHGGAGNVRDLLHLKGVDLAVLNSDVLAYLDQTREYPTARRKIRYVTQLADETIYLVTRKRFATIDQLAGRRVAVPGVAGASGVTARALFALLKMSVTIADIGPRPTIDGPSLADADGVLLVGADIARLRLGAEEGQGWALLALPPTPAIARVYRPVTILPAAVPDLALPAPVESLKLATLLAVFDWKADKPRHQSVLNVIRALFGALGDLKRNASGTFWPETDINASIPDWERYGPAEALRKAVPAADAVVLRNEPAPPAPGGAESPVIPPLRLLVADRPPLSGAQMPSGGLIGELVAASLRASGKDGAERPIRLSDDARDEPVAALSDKLADIAAPVDLPDCDRPNDLAHRSATICDNALISDPLFTVVTGLFTLSDSDLLFETDDSVAGRTLCLPENVDTSDLNRDGRNWLRDNKVTLLRPASLIDCLGLVENRAADAFLANELEGRSAIERLGLTESFRMAERPVATHSLHAIVIKDAEKSAALVAALNAGIARLKKGSEYSAIVAKHLSGLLGARRTE